MIGVAGLQRERRARAGWFSTESTRARRANPSGVGQANPVRASGIKQTTLAVKADRVGIG